jgi:hypothetical protein
MFGGVLSHTMFFCLVLHIFLSAMHGCIGNYYTGDSDRMPHMRCKFDRITFEFPDAPVLRGLIVVISIFLKTASKRPNFPVRSLFLFLSASRTCN